MYIGTPFVIVLCRLFPRCARWFTLGGLFVASLSMMMSSFCNSVAQLIGTQGFLFGLGGCWGGGGGGCGCKAADGEVGDV